MGNRMRHSAFLYRGTREFTGFVLPFICEGLERGESVAVAAGRERIALLTGALGRDAPAVRFLPADEWFVRPVRTINGLGHLLRTAAAAGRPSARVVNEIDFGDQPRSWVRCESALNAALDGLDGHVLCPYDRATLPSTLIDTAYLTHQLIHDDGWGKSDVYTEPEELLADLDEPSFPVSGDPVIAVPIADTVADLRSHLRQRAAAEDWLPPEKVEMLVLAVSELATNGIKYGGGSRELRIWLSEDAVVGEVTDNGADPPSPLAGYLPPVPGEAGGMGLWLVGQVCDALSVSNGDGTTAARFAMRR